MESLFNFLSNESIHNSNVLANLGNTAPVIKNSKLTEDDIIKNYVKRLNNKVNDSRLEFKYSLESKIIPRPNPVAPSAAATINEVIEYTFYLTLTIDGNKVLNILRGKIEKNKPLPLTDIIWQYNLSEEFIDKIFKKGKEEFYSIMSNYYEVVEKQFEMYFNLISDPKSKDSDSLIDIIFIYKNIIINNTSLDFINIFLQFVKSLNKTNFYNQKNLKIYKYYNIFLFFLFLNQKKNSDDFKYKFEFDLDYFMFFYGIVKNTFIDNITIQDLKKKYIDGTYVDLLSNKLINNKVNVQMNRRIKLYEILSETDPEKIEKISEDKMLLETDPEKISDKKKYFYEVFLEKYYKKIKEKQIIKILFDFGPMFFFGEEFIDIALRSYYGIKEIEDTRRINIINNNTLQCEIKHNFIDREDPIEYNKKNNESPKLLQKNTFDFENNKIFLEIETTNFKNNKLFDSLAKQLINILTSSINIKIQDFLKNNLNIENFNDYIQIIIKYEVGEKSQIIKSILKKEESLKEERKLQALKILFDTISGNVTVNRTKKIETKYENSILIISFNEEHSAYDIVDCIPILYKVLTERPLVIVLGSQESTSQLIPAVIGKAVHYPHVLGECLKQIKYGINDDLKASAHKLKFFDKNVRLRTFFDTESISYKNEAPSKNIEIVKFKKSIVKGDYITSYKNKKYIFFENSLSGSFFKGTIFFKIDINFKGKVRKFIFVNSHFFYTEKGNTGSMTRQKLLHKLISMPIKEFNNKSLIQLYSEDSYNVFFFGDLNFRLLIDETQNKLEQIKQIKQKYLKYLNNNLKNESQRNELEKYLNKSIQNFSQYKGSNITNMEQKMVEAGFLDESEKRFVFEGSNLEKEMKEIIDFYQKFKESFDALGYDLLYKYKIKSDDSLSIYNSRKDFYDLYNNNLNHKMNIELFNEKNGKRVPSTTDRILFALNDDIKITRDDLDLYLYPDKSDHLMITLKVSLDNISDNISEVKNVLPVQQVKQSKLDTVLVYEPPSSNSTSIGIPFGKINNSTNNDLQFLVFNFDEKCEELLTDRFYVSKEKTTAKQLQQEIMYAFIQKIKKEKPAIVLVCTRNSPSRTDKHYQHSLKNEILQLNKDSSLGVNYFPLLKSDSTLQSNLTSLKSIGKKLCGIRSRLYVDQTQLNFTYNEKEISKSFSGKGNEMSNEYIYNNNIKKVGENLKTSIAANPSKNIGRIIKYERSRITGNDKKTGSITLNVVIKLKDGSIKQYLFCNYLKEDIINKNNLIINKKNLNSIGYVYFFTNKNIPT